MPDDGRERDAAGGHGVEPAADLRLRAEEAALNLKTEDPAALSVEDVRRLLHELRVHQIELELQNDELRGAQLALEASRARYFDLYDLAPVGYVTLSEQGLILEANLRVALMLGIPRGALVKQPLTRFILAEDQDLYYRHRKELFETDEPQVCELRLKRQDGARRWARIEAAAGPDEESGAPTYWAMISDITEGRALQASLAQADRMASMGVLAAGVAHEINNPLTYVLYNIESLAEDLPGLVDATTRCREALRERVGEEALAAITGADPGALDPAAIADLTERAAQAVEGARRIQEVAAGLSAFSRVEQAASSLVDLNQAVEHALGLAANEIRCRALLVKDLGRLPPILASEGQLTQVFLNLILNATQAIKEGAVEDNRVTVRTWVASGRVRAEVLDTGCGIPQPDQDKIFEPFFTIRGPDRGTGLGLAIVRRIVSELGGEIRVESAAGQGARFSISFPVGRIEAEPPRAGATAAPAARGRVLVVDDEELVCATIKKILGPDHDVVTTCSGRVAQEILGADARFDLVLCDLMMPGVSGIDLHVWLTEHHPRLALDLVFITGGVFTPRVEAYLGSVSNVRIEKPFRVAALRRLVGELVLAARSRT